MTNNKQELETKKFGLSPKARKALCGAFLAGGLFAGQAAQASVPTPTIPDRVAAVRSEMNKRIAEVQQVSGAEAIQKLPFAELQLASWLNWVNWPNWNNWRDWNNWRNWSNWPNWINF
jgi:hypothetical protein